MMAPAMNTRPQAALSYLELARQAARITRQIALRELSRLEDIVVEDGSSGKSLEVTLQFGLTADGHVQVRGDITGDIALVCHGCAEALPYHLAIRFHCVIVESEEAARELDAQGATGMRPEALIVADGREIGLADIVEDEILLALPERLCRAEPCEWAPSLVYRARTGESTDTPGGRGDEKDNPFSVLAELTTTKKTPGE